MTVIKADIKKLQISVRGHAGAGTPGEDLICAACTMLCHAAQETLLARRFGADVDWSPDEARVEIRCKPEKWTDRKSAMERLRVIADGFKWLGKEYPEYVKYEEEI